MSDSSIDRPDILDIALLKNITLQVNSVEVLSELYSDHRPVKLQLGPVGPAILPTRKVIDFKKLSGLLEAKDSVHLSKIPDVVETLEQPKAASLHLTNHVCDATSECSREMPCGFYRMVLTEDARELITNKNRAHREHDKYPTRQKSSVRTLESPEEGSVYHYRTPTRTMGQVLGGALAIA
ncbi:jg4830 [Pararge aegeria aegeria]|uniref:Jg4830 protein n=1 Tax=Pararge aegeria aegeria TaxID=348720 RepID=A0A8S4QGI3_9NEOP|nr:jg4830 [Pararge aegeria aegeria]